MRETASSSQNGKCRRREGLKAKLGGSGHAPPENLLEIGVKWCILTAIYYTFAHFLTTFNCSYLNLAYLE